MRLTGKGWSFEAIRQSPPAGRKTLASNGKISMLRPETASLA